MVEQWPPLWGCCPLCSCRVPTADNHAWRAVVGCVLGEGMREPDEVLTSQHVALEGAPASRVAGLGLHDREAAGILLV